jgi:hypothetical protein
LHRHGFQRQQPSPGPGPNWDDDVTTDNRGYGGGRGGGRGNGRQSNDGNGNGRYGNNSNLYDRNSPQIFAAGTAAHLKNKNWPKAVKNPTTVTDPGLPGAHGSSARNPEIPNHKPNSTIESETKTVSSPSKP